MYPLLARKGYALYNCNKRNILGIGPKKCGKTVSVADRFLRHIWEVDGSVAACICKTQNNAKIGSWRDLTRIVLPGWVDAHIGFEVLVHKHDPSSKMEYFIVRNQAGGTSEIQLHSLHNEIEVEDKFRSARFSCIWLAESDLFELRATYDALEMQLRMPHLHYDQHLFLFDCNPPESGEDHWLIRKFWDECNPESEYYVEGLDAKMARFEFNLNDNPFLPQEEKDGIKRTYQNDPMGYARFVEGKIVKDVTEGHFAGFFIENIHNIGNARSPDPREWETLVPSNSHGLLVGIDTGEMSHSSTLICPRLTDKGETAYDVFDEVVSVESPIGLKTYFKKLAARMTFWNQWMTETYQLHTLPTWRIWPDSSLWNFRANAERSDLDVLLECLKESKVTNYQVQPVLARDQKAKGEIAKRIAITKRLLHDNRLFISAHCKFTLDALRFLRPAKHGKRIGQIVKPGIPERHPFDSMTYAIAGEAPMEGQGQAEPPKSTGIF